MKSILIRHIINKWIMLPYHMYNKLSLVETQKEFKWVSKTFINKINIFKTLIMFTPIILHTDMKETYINHNSTDSEIIASIVVKIISRIFTSHQCSDKEVMALVEHITITSILLIKARTTISSITWEWEITVSEETHSMLVIINFKNKVESLIINQWEEEVEDH